MGFSIGGLVQKILPKVAPLIGNIMSSPVGKIGLDILKQLASSAFSKDGKGGVFSENFQLTLPNPLSRLNKLLGNLGKNIGSVSDFLKNISNFLQGKRTLESGREVNVPRTGERAEISASSAASTSKELGTGKYDAALATRRSASTAGGGIVGGIKDAAFSTALTEDQNKILAKVKDPTQKAQMEAQFEMQNYQNLMSFMSNIMRIMGDISKGVIQNIR